MNRYLKIGILLSSLTFASCPHNVTVIPDSREIKEYSGHPGYYIISAGHLKALFDQQRILAAELEKCKLNLDTKK